MDNMQEVYLYLKQVISHQSIFWPLYCGLYNCEDMKFCEYMRGAEDE